MARMGKDKKQSFESCRLDTSNEKYTRIFVSQLQSPAFLDLTKNQRLLYIYCKQQFGGSGVSAPGRDHPDLECLQNGLCFYYNLSLAVKDGLYSKSGKKELARDLKALGEHGFIDRVSDGELTHSKSIYRFSSGWKTWPDNDVVWMTKANKGNKDCL